MYDEENVVKKVYLIKTQDIKLSGDIINLPENIRLSNGYIVGICFKDTSHKERFISIFKGSNTKRLIRKLQSDKGIRKKLSTMLIKTLLSQP